MKKVIITVLSVIMLVSVVAVPVSAAAVDNGTVQPLWTNTTMIDCDIALIDGVGYAESIVKGKFGATSVKTDMYLYKQVGTDWVYVTELHDIQYQRAAGTSCSFQGVEGEYFRADYTFTVTKGGVDEVINRTIYQVLGQT